MELTCTAVLFDVDGTLVDSAASMERAWRVWAAEYGVDIDTLLRVHHGMRTTETVALFLPPAVRAAAAERMDALELADDADIVPIPGAARLLAGLPPDRWAVVTSGSVPLATSRMAAAGLPWPAVAVTAESIAEGKPDPSCYLLAASLLDAPPARCLVVEDAPAGVRAGKAAGATVLGLTTSHPAPALDGADYVLPSLEAVRMEPVDGGIRVTLGD
jgi:mannitol-1-/sugar-/sorbitol-6-phosphatase